MFTIPITANADDICFIWTQGKEKLGKFLEGLNSFDNKIKSTHESSKENITFPSKENVSKSCLTTNLHIKDTDRHQYFHFNSSHPNDTKKLIICRQTLYGLKSAFDLVNAEIKTKVCPLC